ncbi:hypothetical protein GcM1_203012 [Golovinomyces cichoracearum]|uniref:Uncharacterized protein n=1 Tax=Golovinomyces cichoracearum TaxID=62708 RepID=A0A420IXN0_9PEZI|nr:hypothetical protein GcM1_203012 [Golovinomyces cichoracearum]
MLKGLALDIYYMNELSNMSFQNAIEHLRNYFQGPEFHRKNLSEWNSITLKTVIVENPDKSIGECLLLPIKTLRKLQHGLREAQQTIEYAVSDPPPTVGALINKLQSSIIAYEKENVQSKAYFTDRQYHKNVPSSNIDTTRRCYVCHKEDCRSWNHSEQDQDNYINKFKEEFKNRLRPRLFNNKQFQKRFKQ